MFECQFFWILACIGLNYVQSWTKIRAIELTHCQVPSSISTRWGSKSLKVQSSKVRSSKILSSTLQLIAFEFSSDQILKRTCSCEKLHEAVSWFYYLSRLGINVHCTKQVASKTRTDPLFIASPKVLGICPIMVIYLEL